MRGNFWKEMLTCAHHFPLFSYTGGEKGGEGGREKDLGWNRTDVKRGRGGGSEKRKAFLYPR